MKGKTHMKLVRLFRALGLAAITLAVCHTLAAQGDLTAIQQKLNSQFKLTTLTSNGLDIVGAGDVVEMQKDGLKMSALASPLMESNTYKDGKIGGGAAKRAWGGLGVALLQGVAAGTDTSGATTVPDAIPGHNAAAGEKLWVVAATAQKDGINFKLYTDADGNGIRYHANLKVLFPNKKQVPSVDAAMNLVAEVLTVVPQDNQADQSAQPAQDGPYAALAGEYLFEQSGHRYILLPDGSSTIRDAGGTTIQCHSTIDGDWIRVMTNNSTTPLWNIKIQGDKLYLNGTVELVRQGGSPAPAPAPTPEPAADTAQGGEQAGLLGWWYAQDETHARLRLSTDGSCVVLSDGHPPMTGQFIFNGETLALTLSANGRSASVLFRIQGDKLYDPDGKPWARSGGAPAPELAPAEAAAAVAPPAPAPVSVPVPMPDIAPPPPPADVAPPTIELGQTMDQVTTGFGQPLRIAKLGVKTIFYYKDMKVTFTNGKVSNVE
jgi:hypothetical protein